MIRRVVIQNKDNDILYPQTSTDQVEGLDQYATQEDLAEYAKSSDVNQELNKKLSTDDASAIYATAETVTNKVVVLTNLINNNSQAISNESTRAQTAEGSLNTSILTIQSKIPDAASQNNQLADKAYVNDAISTASAEFRGTTDTLSVLQALEGDDNDYAYLQVINDVTGQVQQYDRYKYTKNGWVYEYTLNNSSFTQEQ